MQWIALILSFAGSLLGGVLTPWVNSRLSQTTKKVERIKQARVAVERWYATRVGPTEIEYPGLERSLLGEVNRRANLQFFDRHFEESYKVRAALGEVRQYDERIGEILDDSDDWRLPEKRVDELRDALKDAERLARRRWCNRR